MSRKAFNLSEWDYMPVRIGNRNAAQKRRSKYGAVKTTIEGITFDSAKEARRYQELRLLEKLGDIFGLELQPRYVLSVNAEEEGSLQEDPPVILGAYVADFQYRDTRRANALVVEDVKGFKTPLYRWKKKHVEAQYGIQIREV